MKERGIALALLLIAVATVSIARNARAEVAEMLRLLETPSVRLALLATPEGAAVLERFGAADLGELHARLEESRFSSAKAELEERLERVERGSREAPEGLQGAQIRELAARELRLNPAWKPGQTLFFDHPPAGYGSTRAKLLASEPEPADIEPPKTPQPEARKGVVRRARGLVEDMRTCVRNRPPGAAKKASWKYMLTQWGIDEAMTTTGSIMSAGIKKMEWKNLPSDILFDSISSLGSSRIVSRPGTVTVRWMRFAGFGVGQAAVDAVIYYVSPVKDGHGKSDRDAAIDRFEYNVGWNMSYSPIRVGMFELVNGLECLYPESKGLTAGLTALRFGESLGSNILYFKIRRHFLNSDSTN